ncbi:MAG: trypsin-like peptidase domain-containing protein, partial [archaeon]|nr:trypsin-like peptidase domain-containing protein [archaeon]
MNIYNLPEFNIYKIKKTILEIKKNKVIFGSILAFLIFFAVGFGTGIVSLSYFPSQIKSFLQGVKINIPVINKDNINQNVYTPQISYEQAIINSVKEASPSVVSIIISKNLPVYEQQWINPFGGLDVPGFEVPKYVQKGTKQQEVGGGSGFIVSEDGLVLTNKHVVADKNAEYTVFTNDGQKFSAKVLARDPVQDLAIIKIEKILNGSEQVKFKAIKLGD